MKPGSKATVEEQLAQYRARKKREEQYKSVKTRLLDLFWSVMSPSRSNNSATESEVSASEAEDQQISENSSTEGLRKRIGAPKDYSSGNSTDYSDAGATENVHSFSTYTKLDWISLGLKCAMWISLFKIFIILEFGAVFFIFSAFIFIWYNMRSGPKERGEISAYSVFNPNCEKIDGTLSAEQLEREILHKM